MESKPSFPRYSRRRLLKIGGGLSLTTGLGGYIRYRSDRTYPDQDADGIPDSVKRSESMQRTLASTFGEQFEGLRVGRRDLLLDVRYVGDVSVPLQVKHAIRRRLRNNGIHLQWLDHPKHYPQDWFEREYGNNARMLLWGRDSFYRQEIEEELKDIALQLVMVPGAIDGPYKGRIYSPWADLAGTHSNGYINGMNFGNRAVAAKRQEPWEQTRLIFHEVAHLALCHDSDPDNRGVMGTNETLTLTDEEWERLRSNLDNVRDTTGYDLLARTCLWFDDPGTPGIADTPQTCPTCVD